MADFHWMGWKLEYLPFPSARGSLDRCVKRLQYFYIKPSRVERTHLPVAIIRMSCRPVFLYSVHIICLNSAAPLFIAEWIAKRPSFQMYDCIVHKYFLDGFVWIIFRLWTAWFECSPPDEAECLCKMPPFNNYTSNVMNETWFRVWLSDPQTVSVFPSSLLLAKHTYGPQKGTVELFTVGYLYCAYVVAAGCGP